MAVLVCDRLESTGGAVCTLHCGHAASLTAGSSASAVLLLIHCHKPSAIPLLPFPWRLCVVRWGALSQREGFTCVLVFLSSHALSALTACYHRQARNETLNSMDGSLRDVHTDTAASLPWGLALRLRGASQLRLSARRSSRCCSRCPPQRGSSRALLRRERGLTAGQSPPCEDMRCFGSLHFHFQQNEGRFLFLGH